VWRQPEIGGSRAGYGTAEKIRGRRLGQKDGHLQAVKEQMASIAEDEPDESTEFDGMVDLHWWFDSYGKAERLANSLREISHKPEIVALRLSCYDDVTASVTLKDERQRH
jgi:hypothetical protein